MMFKTLSSLGSALDVSSYRTAMDALGASEERLRAALTASGLIAWDWDVNSGELRFVEPSASFSEMYSRTLPGNFASLQESDRERVTQAIKACIDRGIDIESGFQIPCADGTAQYVAMRGAVARDATGCVARVSGPWSQTRDSGTRRTKADEEADQKSVL